VRSRCARTTACVFGAAPKTLEPIVVIAFDSVRAGTLLAALAKLTRRRRNRSQNKVLLMYLIFLAILKRFEIFFLKIINGQKVD